MLGYAARGMRAWGRLNLASSSLAPSLSSSSFSSLSSSPSLSPPPSQQPTLPPVVSRNKGTWTFTSSPLPPSPSPSPFSLPNLLSSPSPSSFSSFFSSRRNYSQKNEQDEKEKEKDSKKEEKKVKEEGKKKEKKGEEKKEEPRRKEKKMNYEELAEQVLPSNAKGWVGLSALVTAVLYVVDSQRQHNQGEKVTLTHFISNVLPDQNIGGLTVFTVGEKGKKNICQYTLHGRNYQFEAPSQEVLESVLEEAQLALDRPHQNHIPIYYREVSEYSFVSMFHFLLLMSLIIFTLRSVSFGGAGGADMGGIFQTGKNPAKMYNPSTSLKVKFDEVAGLHEAKTEVMEFVSFLKNPKDFQKLGAKIPRGALFVGPPGTGKTMLAKATAAEAGVPFYSVSGSDFVELYGGNGPARVRSLFSQARGKAPCLVFIDEIDAIGKKRSGSRFRSNDERENTLNQLLVEMDGFDSDSGVVVLGGTNIPDILDPALLRPGRFDRRINVDLPDIRSRKEIFQVYLKKIALSEEIKPESVADRMAAMTAGLSGADIANICNEAALRAGRLDEDAVTVKDLEVATERVLIGLERRLVLSHEEKRTIAYHEAGHAIMGWFLEHTQPLMKVSIIPRGQAALGYAQYIPKDQYLYTKAQIEDIICMALGGRIAEEVSIGKVTTGARDDLDRVTKMSYSLVTKYGMGKIGPLSFRNSRGEKEMVTAPYSDLTANEIDEEVRGEVQRLYNRSRDLITEKKELLSTLAEELLKKEVLTRHQVAEILGPRPYETKDYALEMYDRIMEEEKGEGEKKEESKEK